MNTMYLIDLMIMLAAIYVLYLGIEMKKTMKIHKSMMAKEMIEKCKDQAGFVSYIFPSVMIFGIVSIVAGIMGFLFDYFQFASYYTYISCGLFLLVFLLFVVVYKKAMSKFFES